VEQSVARKQGADHWKPADASVEHQHDGDAKGVAIAEDEGEFAF